MKASALPDNGAPRTSRDLRALLEHLPDGALVPVGWVRPALGNGDGESPAATAAVAVVPQPETWRTRLWSCPPDTRLGVVELAEALGRPKSAVYRLTAPSTADPIPSARIDGCLAFTAGDVRSWIERRTKPRIAVRR